MSISEEVDGYTITYRDWKIKSKYDNAEENWTTAKQCWLCKKNAQDEGKSEDSVLPAEEWTNKYWTYIMFDNDNTPLAVRGYTVLCKDHSDYNPVPPGRPVCPHDNNIVLVTRTSNLS